jgi:hypothetical protein
MTHVIRRLLVALSLLSLVLMFLACAARPAPPPSNNPPSGGPFGSNNPPAPKPPETPPGDKPDAEMTALQYQAEFGGPGGWDAYQRYKDRFLKVIGKVGGYSYDLQGVGLLFLDGNTRFACEGKRPAARALPGQTVTLRGKPTSGLGSRSGRS